MPGLAVTRRPKEGVLIGDDLYVSFTHHRGAVLWRRGDNRVFEFRIGERQEVAPEVQVTLLALHRRQARWRIEAPLTVRVVREELIDRGRS